MQRLGHGQTCDLALVVGQSFEQCWCDGLPLLLGEWNGVEQTGFEQRVDRACIADHQIGAESTVGLTPQFCFDRFFGVKRRLKLKPRHDFAHADLELAQQFAIPFGVGRRDGFAAWQCSCHPQQRGGLLAACVAAGGQSDADREQSDPLHNPEGLRMTASTTHGSGVWMLRD